MRIEWHDTDDITNMGQFVIYAETEMDSAIIRRFVAMNQNEQYLFRLHGWCHSVDLGRHTSFNFGFSKKK